MAEFSTTKITPNDSVQIPSVNGQVAGYQENDELKSYVLGTLPTQVQTNTEDIGENTSDIGGIRGSSQAFDATSSYSAGDYCIYENVLYRFTSAKSAGAWDSAIVAVVDLPTLDGAVTSLNNPTTYDISVSGNSYFTPASGISVLSDWSRLYKMGKVIIAHFIVKRSSSLSADTTIAIGTLSDSIKPKDNSILTVASFNMSGNGGYSYVMGGVVYAKFPVALNANSEMDFFGVWVTN